MSKIEPLNPDDVVQAKKQTIPDEVIEAFNESIAENWRGTYSNFTQESVVNKIIDKLPDLPEDDIYSRGYLDVEDIFRAAGWDVEYDNHDVSEKYRANFTFSKMKKG